MKRIFCAASKNQESKLRFFKAATVNAENGIAEILRNDRFLSKFRVTKQEIEVLESAQSIIYNLTRNVDEQLD